MPKIRLYTAAFAAYLPMLAFVVPARGATPNQSTQSAIKAENARWSDAYRRGDYEAVGRLYTADGALLPPGGDRVIGPRAIAEYFTKKYAGSEPGSVSFSNFEFYGNDETVAEVSDVEVRDHSGNLKGRGKQTLIFVKQGKTWELQRDIWNEYPPEAAGR